VLLWRSLVVAVVVVHLPLLMVEILVVVLVVAVLEILDSQLVSQAHIRQPIMDIPVETVRMIRLVVVEEELVELAQTIHQQQVVLVELDLM
jgi:hypothetical protein